MLDTVAVYHCMQFQGKLMIQSWENLEMDRWTDGWADGQMDESDFMTLFN